MAMATDRSSTRVADGLGELRFVQFTFDVQVGGLRRREVDALAFQMSAAGLEVAWSDTRVGLRGIRRRFTVDGSAGLVQKLIDEIGIRIGWSAAASAV